VLLKNQDGVLPLAPKQRVLVAGDGADDLGKQSGGWTLNWQGTGTKRADYPNADSIWDGLKQQVTAAGGSAELAIDGRYRTKPDVAVVVVGENPYAEFQGDIATLAYKPGDDSDLQLIKRLRSEGIKVVTVFLSGRPLWVNREINASDAFVAAWLPGSEGAGIADVLLRKPDGSVQHDFKGTLSFSWPRTAVQYQNNVGQKDYDPQFAFGFGLRYADNGNLAALPEASGITGEQGDAGVYFNKGKPAAGLAMRLSGVKQSELPAVTFPAVLSDASLKVTAVDHKAQEDARRLQWSGSGKADMTLLSTRPLDLTRESNGDVQLLLTVRRSGAISGPVGLAIGCGQGCEGRLDLAATLGAIGEDEWQTIGVPLKCFAAAGADLSKIERLPVLESSNALDLSVSRIALGTGNDAQTVVACPTR
jgi:beta-glucosidase